MVGEPLGFTQVQVRKYASHFTGALFWGDVNEFSFSPLM